jgi:hypothetical protein
LVVVVVVVVDVGIAGADAAGNGGKAGKEGKDGRARAEAAVEGRPIGAAGALPSKKLPGDCEL